MGFLYKSELREFRKMIKEKAKIIKNQGYVSVSDILKVIEKFSYLPTKRFFKKCGYKIPKDAWK